MANEVQVFEMIGERGGSGARPVTFRAKQTLSIGGAASSAFDPSTSFITLISTTGCLVEFGTAPDGLGNTFPIVAGQLYDFGAYRGQKVIVVAGTATAPVVSIAAGGATGTEYTEDAASAANPVGGILIARRRDVPVANEVSAEGDNIALNSDSKGRLYVNAANSSLTAAALGDGSVDTAETITVANTVQVVEFFNLSANVIWASWTGTAAAATTGSFPIPALASGVAGYYSSPPGASGSLSIIAVGGASAFTCIGWS